MPELVGLRQNDAQIVLGNARFRPASVRFVESYEEIGTVVHQHPMRGQLVDNDSEVWIHIAKRNYVQYLPQIFQIETATGNSFLREYLWVFQHQFESITEKLDHGHRYFDPQETPDKFLNWLASWVALTLDIDWPTIKKRKMIKAASEMYKYRGTRRALIEVLEIFLGKRPRIEENAWPYNGFRIGVSSTVAEDTIILPPIKLDHTFMVHIPVGPDEITEEMVVKVHNIIKLEKPAHATYFLQFKSDDEKSKPQLFMQIGVSAMGVADMRYSEQEEDEQALEAPAPRAEVKEPKPKKKATAIEPEPEPVGEPPAPDAAEAKIEEKAPIKKAPAKKATKKKSSSKKTTKGPSKPDGKKK